MPRDEKNSPSSVLEPKTYAQLYLIYIVYSTIICTRFHVTPTPVHAEERMPEYHNTVCMYIYKNSVVGGGGDGSCARASAQKSVMSRDYGNVLREKKKKKKN